MSQEQDKGAIPALNIRRNDTDILSPPGVYDDARPAIASDRHGRGCAIEVETGVQAARSDYIGSVSM